MLGDLFESLVWSLHWVHHRGKQPLSCLHGSKFWQSFGDWPLICTHMDAANLVRTATEDGEMHADEREIFTTTTEDLEHGIAGQMECLGSCRFLYP